MTLSYAQDVAVWGYDTHGCNTYSILRQHVVGEQTTISPSGNFSYCGTTPGQTLTLSDAEVPGITRQWYWHQGTVDTAIPAATGSSYTPAVTDFPSAGQYEIYAVSTGCTNTTVTSYRVKLKVSFKYEGGASPRKKAATSKR